MSGYSQRGISRAHRHETMCGGCIPVKRKQEVFQPGEGSTDASVVGDGQETHRYPSRVETDGNGAVAAATTRSAAGRAPGFKVLFCDRRRPRVKMLRQFASYGSQKPVNRRQRWCSDRRLT